MKAHYEIDHYPNLVTHLFVAYNGARILVSDRQTLGQAQQYIRDSFNAHGVEPVYSEKWEDGVKLVTTQDIEVEETNA